MKVYVPIPGQEENIGDVLHRRELIKMLSRYGDLHIYAGSSCEGFVSSVLAGCDAKVKVYTSFSSWVFSIFSSLLSGVIFCFNSGEMTSGRRRIFKELYLLPLLFVVKVFGGKVLRIGVAFKKNDEVGPVWKKLLKLSNFLVWRTHSSKEKVGYGTVMPDLAFYHDAISRDGRGRDKLVISMRYDRLYPSDEWYEAVRDFAKINKLTIVVVVQVKMDNQRAAEMAQKLECECVQWPDNVSHYQQELALINEYSSAALVVSDRLHVLVLAMTCGANVCALLTEQSAKVQDHFDVVGIENSSHVHSSFCSSLEYLNERLVWNGETDFSNEKERLISAMDKVVLS